MLNLKFEVFTLKKKGIFIHIDNFKIIKIMFRNVQSMQTFIMLASTVCFFVTVWHFSARTQEADPEQVEILCMQVFPCISMPVYMKCPSPFKQLHSTFREEHFDLLKQKN